MAFLNKARGILQHTIRKHINSEISPSTPSIFQAIRCMSSKLFVGGLSYQTDENSLTEAFEKYGEVVEARIIVDRETGNSRGFGFVTFQNTESASSAIMALDGKDFQGRIIRVNHAHDRARASGGGYGNYGGGTYGNGYVDGGYGGGNSGVGGVGGGYGGGGNYNNNFGANHGAEGSGSGYGLPAGDRYASGGSIGTYASSGGSYGGGNSYSSGTGTYGGNNFDSRNVGYDGGNHQNFGVAGGGGGSENYSMDNSNAASGFTGTGSNSNSGLSYGGGNQFGNNTSNDMADAAGSYNQNDGGNFQDDESHDLLDRRAP